ncbi:MAG TPA: glycosyltransferase family 1 protein [Hyphomicrobiales bacterium]|nr:glycosyltransferase family 1 protein [Hyphomicrobiales bacterium]
MSARPARDAPQRRWTVNGRFLAQPVTGVQRYGREILGALDGLIVSGHPLARDLEVELVMPQAATPPPLAAIAVRRAGRGTGQAWEQLVLPFAARGAILSLCNTGPLVLGRQIVCIHDTSVWDYPASYSRRFRGLYRTLLPALGRRAAAIATVSHYSAARLLAHRVVRTPVAEVIPDGHEHVRTWAPAGGGTAALGTFALVLGSPAPHKNLALVLALADLLEGTGIRIAVAGALDRAVFAAAPAANSDRVTWLGRLSDAALAELLGGALCLLFPSFSEGFGLPPLEAMALGCPVVASNRASMPEICGEAALYAAPDDPPAWRAALLRLRDDATLRRRLAAAGAARARRFSWQRSAEAYLDLMARLDGVADSITPALVRAAE